jgi:hypothetical protein
VRIELPSSLVAGTATDMIKRAMPPAKNATRDESAVTPEGVAGGTGDADMLNFVTIYVT